jgi:hypothetical protein
MKKNNKEEIVLGMFSGLSLWRQEASGANATNGLKRKDSIDCM